MDVGGWLRSLGLEQYETLFRENDIDAEVLGELTDADLEKFGVSFGLAAWHRVRGQIALKKPEPDRARAEACFLKAIEIARSQEAHLLELRAGIDLARLWRETGSPNDPRALLQPILAQIEGGDATRDVRNARALLAEIGSRELTFP